MRRLASYPRTSVVLKHKTIDGHGNVSSSVNEDLEVVWTEEVRRMTFNNTDFLIQSWYISENKPSNEHMTVTKDSREYAVAGWVSYNDYGLNHYQVFLA